LSKLISAVICTYGRSTALDRLLQCLQMQRYTNFEVLVVDGNGEISPARSAVEQFLQRTEAGFDLSVIRSPRGLTRQRNVGLAAAKGDVICFLDDDVTFDSDFLANVAAIFDDPGMHDVGGITAYDPLNYAAAETWRWRLRRAFGVIPDLTPGQVDHLGRAVPLSFLKPSNDYRQIGWLAGFCMIYRTAAIGDLRFDEALGTYGGEDRDFSIRVGMQWKLLVCGHLRVKHHCSAQGRDTDLQRLGQSSFGVGRRFAKYARTYGDYVTIVRTVLGDLVIDAVAFVRKPSRASFLTAFVRLRCFFAGFWSSATHAYATPPPTSFEQSNSLPRGQ
jgi:glycosyltransferase involved in cell wall biosynthesis